jgi:chemotaxis protein methyltransferase CheR
MVDKTSNDFIEFDDLDEKELLSFNTIIHNVYRRRGVDFRQYRPRCLRRRIVVGMHDANVNSFAEYLEFLNRNPDGYDKLLDRITINVSEFFRNPETFEAVREKVLPALVERKAKTGASALRIWSAGCARGEEPYSLAILCKEFFDNNNLQFTANIFATDIDSGALRKAESGRYQAKAFRELKHYQVSRYFEKLSDDEYGISQEIKFMVKFTRHNMIDDAPLLRIDLILCRNVIIYFSKPLQKRVYDNFYKALAPQGFLVAGKTESLMDVSETRYEKIDLMERILKKK